MKPIDLNEPQQKGERMYTSWRNEKGIECKMIGPETKCLCDHRYKEHTHDVITLKTHCKNKKCSCPQFFYIPTYGSYDFKCLCKHSYKFHDPITHRCTKGNCGGCNKGFNSTWTCACGSKFHEHTTIFESTSQRRGLGKPVDDMERMVGELESREIENLQKEIIEENEQKNYAIFSEMKKKEQLKALNKKIEKETINTMQNTMEIKEEYDEEYDPEFVSALNLYRTPHVYIRYNLKI